MDSTNLKKIMGKQDCYHSDINRSLCEAQYIVKEMVISGAQLSDVIKAITHFISKELLNTVCALFILDRKGQSVKLGAISSAERQLHFGMCFPILKDGLFETSILQNQPVINSDGIQTSDFLPFGIITEDYLSISVFPLFSSKGNALGFITFLHKDRNTDATDIFTVQRWVYLTGLVLEHDDREQQLLENEMKFKAVFQHANDAIYLHELPKSHENIQFFQVNDVACRRLGYSREELLELGPVDIIDPTRISQLGEVYKQLNEQGQLYFESALKGKDGKIHPVEISLSIIPFDDKKWVITISRDISHRKQVEAEIRHMAFHDFLTDLPNRRMFQEELKHTLNSLTEDQEAAVLFIDLDRFKNVNDTFGHLYGDTILQKVAQRLRQLVDEQGLIARMGGDEFTILLPRATKESAVEKAERILHEIQSPILIEQQEFYLSASVGIALAPRHGKDVEEMMKHADQAMYQAKERGGNTYEFFHASNLAERYILENELRKALSQQEFTLVYQPRMSLKTGSIVGMEALIRWYHPKRGWIPPDQFIPLTEETGLIIPIGNWVLKEACKQLKEWQSQGVQDIRVSVNLSTVQLQSKHLLSELEAILTETQLDPYSLELEITESALMENITMAAQTLQKIKEKGIRISIDDFGTGYSSLKYLQHLPVDALKIDRSFTQEIKRGMKAAIPKSIVQLAHTLQMEVVAEGVETLDQFEFLVEHRCDEIQGYYLEKPLKPSDMATFLKPWLQEKQI
ncbi:MAG TPA: EAL domain-containing protein [Bacillota bacterium]|nr:EAL domain-containing protein [Bacillota bacterium]